MQIKDQKESTQETSQESQGGALGKMLLGTREEKTKRKPLTELYVKGHFTEGREEWQQELQRHCDEVYTDQEETNEIQED